MDNFDILYQVEIRRHFQQSCQSCHDCEGGKMNKVISKDGTFIAFDKSGQGPALILVVGASVLRLDAASLAANLAPHFTVFAYDRRGRGDSGDNLAYAVEREIEDIDALITEAGGSAFVFGHSSGAVLALMAAGQLSASIKKLAVYEPPMIVDDSRPPLPEDYVAQLTTLVSSGQRSKAVQYYLATGLGMSDEMIAQTQKTPRWTRLETLAHTLAYDGAIVAHTTTGKPLSKADWASVTMPTLVMVGGDSPAFFHSGTQALAHVLPNAQHRRLPGQSHGVADEVLVPVLVEFFKG
jgi:pimeloyl-ACP methyl ester carboxylesterase